MMSEMCIVDVAGGDLLSCFFFFQAEDGIRDVAVTGVQTCALPISRAREDVDRRRPLLATGAVGKEEFDHAQSLARTAGNAASAAEAAVRAAKAQLKIGRASCRERV